MTDHTEHTTEELRRRCYHLGLNFQGGRYDLLERLKGLSYPVEDFPRGKVKANSIHGKIIYALVDHETGDPTDGFDYPEMVKNLTNASRTAEEAADLVVQYSRELEDRYGYLLHTHVTHWWVERRELRGTQ